MMHRNSHLDRYFIIALTITISSYGNAQQVFPTTTDLPRWNVLGGYGDIGIAWAQTSQWELSGDTVICGEVYDIGSQINTPGGLTAYTRVEGERVYLRRTTDCITPELLLYDFSISVGDTILCASEFYEVTETKFWPAAIDTISMFGVSRKRLDMRYIWNPEDVPDSQTILEMIWVEGIGSLVHPFHPIAFNWHFGHFYSSVLCYWEQEEQFYQNPFFNTCDTSYSIIQSMEDQGAILASLGPNPFSESFDVVSQNNDPFSAELFAADGRIVFRKEQINGTAMLGEGLSLGTYLLRITHGGYSQWAKVVKAPGP